MRQSSPYAKFNSYNQKELTENFQQQTIQPQPQNIQQHMKPHQMQQMQQMQPQQMQPQQMQPQQMQPQQMQPQQMQPQQMQPQQMQQQMQQMPSRYKMVTSSQHLHDVLTNGLKNFQDSFQSKNMPIPDMKIFIKLYTDWCGPCKQIAPVLDEMSILEQHQDVIFLMFNADLMIKGQDQYSKQLTSILKIGAVPAFFAVFNGKIIGNEFGANMDKIGGLLNSLHMQR